jgi:hypothetical protein
MPEPHLRAADTDREAVAVALGRHMADGRLTADLPAPRPARARPPAPARAARSTHAWQAAARPGVCGPRPWHGDPEQAWRAWLSTSVIVLVVYLAVSLARSDLGYFWPMWVIGPWGAALLAHRITGRFPHPGRPAGR